MVHVQKQLYYTAVPQKQNLCHKDAPAHQDPSDPASQAATKMSPWTFTNLATAFLTHSTGLSGLCWGARQKATSVVENDSTTGEFEGLWMFIWLVV